MNRQTERDQFIANLTRECADKPAHVVTNAARLLLRHAKTYHRLQEMACNGHPIMSRPDVDVKYAGKVQAEFEAWTEKREGQIERRMTEIAGQLGLEIDFQGDPRGYTAKVRFPHQGGNTWAGDNWYGIPSI